MGGGFKGRRKAAGLAGAGLVHTLGFYLFMFKYRRSLSFSHYFVFSCTTMEAVVKYNNFDQ